MTKEETKNGIIGLVVLIVIVGGIYFYKNNQKEETPIPENVDILVPPTENIEDVTPGTEETTTGESSEVNSNPVVTKPEIITADKTKFNTLLQEGSKAFMDKNYSLAIKKYNEALVLDASDVVYIRLYSVYNAQGDIKKAEEMLNKAIAKNPSYTDYWTTKLTFLDEMTTTSFTGLKKVYAEGLTKVDPKTKINLVTTFAGIAESNGEINEAISLWTYAKTLYPENASIYDQEINRLK
ncbi:MAG: hypothetical protein M3Q34_04300 [bacterium]|nr:hypothetical protein [bacterium]